MKKYIIGLSMLIGLCLIETSCSNNLFFLKLAGVYKTPRWQSEQTIKTTIAKGKGYYDGLYYLNNINNFLYMSNNKVLEFPGILLFNNKLELVKAFNGSDCSVKAQDFIMTLNKNSKTEKDTSIKVSIKELLQHSKFLAGDSVILKKGNFDYLYLYTWATWIPKFMKEVFESSQKIHQNKSVQIKIMALNEDFLSDWTKNSNQLFGKKVKMKNLGNYNYREKIHTTK